LRVDVPKEESVRLGRVGLIAGICFLIGILWPRFAGVRLVPSVPTEKAETATRELSGAPADPQASASSAAAAADVPPPSPAATPSPSAPFSVGSAEVSSCRDEKGKKLDDCDPIDFEAVGRGRIATLAACDAAERAEGVLSLGFELDFAQDRVVGVQSGKSTSLPQDDVDDLLTCLRQNLGQVSLSGIRHEHARYTVYFRVEFAGTGAKKAEAEPVGDVNPASGKATVAWDVALVRKSPVKDAPVIARVLQGTRVTVSGRHGDWYRVKFDGKGNEGWVFRTAIGM
jgi:hypothetical protein